MNKLTAIIIFTVAIAAAMAVPAVECGGGALRLLSYNVRHCSGKENRIHYSQTAAAIQREAPDFAGLQEIDVGTTRSKGVDQGAELSRLTGMHVTFAKAIAYGGGEYGVAVLSREKPLSAVRKPLPGPEPRVLLLCEFTNCWFGTTHLDSGVCKGDTEPAHVLSVPIISNTVSQCASSGKPVFLTGDWNATPQGRLVEKMEGFITILNDKKVPTNSSERRTIDYVTVDRRHANRVTVKETHVTPDRTTSDHKPVFVAVDVAPVKPVEVRVRQTPQGPRISVDGKAVRPRFYYGSPPCLCPISNVKKHEYTIPFRPEADTDKGRVSLDGFDDDAPMWFSNAALIDKTDNTTMRLSPDGEERTRHFVREGLHLKKGHLYHFVVTHRSTHHRTYFTHEASYTDADGRKVVMPLPYGDTLGDTIRLAADAQVDFVTFSTDTSWGCMNWWAPPGAPSAYGRIDREFEHIIAANPNALIVPRVCADAPGWMLERDSSLRMVFDKGYPVRMSSVSARPYREAACAEVEKLTRHLRGKFPRNFAGLHVSGQNSAEWFYMMSQSGELSGYDVHTRDAFRVWLAKRGEKDAATAEVPSPEARRVKRPLGRLDPVLDRRVIQFGEFRQEEMASLLCDLGAAVRRGSDGGSLAIFFYGYTWELGAVVAGAAETGHFFVDWIMRHGKDNIDGFSAPFSYSDRGWPGSSPVMAPSETFMRNGFLWINEDDYRTHLENLWSFPVNVGLRNRSPFVTRNALLRNGALNILRGHGDWWMDLCGRGWFRDAEMWKIRKALNVMDDAMMHRKKPYSPEIALVVDEKSLMRNGFGSGGEVRPQLTHTRLRLNLCGATHGQYLLDDVLANPPDCKLLFIAYARDLDPERRARLEKIKRTHPQMHVVMADTKYDVVTEKIMEHAKAAGVHFYTPPLKATVCAAEGYVVVQAREEGPLEIDFGKEGPVVDFLTGKQIGVGPKFSLPFQKGETKIFRLVEPVAPAAGASPKSFALTTP